MKKIVAATFLGILLLVIICGCSEKNTLNENRSAEYEVEYLSFEESIKRSNSCVLGEYEETVLHDVYVEYKFKIHECLYGSVEDAEIYLYSNIGTAYIDEIDYSFKPEKAEYEKGKLYILIMECYKSTLFDHDRYILNSDLLLDETDGKYTMYSKDIDIPEGLSAKEYICSIYSSSSKNEKIKDDIVYDNEIDEFFEESDFIGCVNIVTLINEGITHNGDTFKCIVDELYKGEKLITDEEDGTILLVIKKGNVEVGNKYIIGFNQVSEYSLIYTQSTEKAVFRENDEKIINHFETLQ